MLFRPEAVEARSSRVHGDILIGQSSSAWSLTCAVFMIMIASMAWAASASYARTEGVVGILTPDKSLVTVLPAQPGIVTKLLARDGELVRAGQPLAIISVEQSGLSGRTAAVESLEAVEVQRRIIEDRLKLEAERTASEGRRLRRMLAGLSSEAQAIEQQIELQKAIIESSRRTFDRIEGIVAQGFVSRLEYERRRQAHLALEQQLRTLEQQRAANATQQAQTAAELSSLPLDSATRLGEVRSELQNLVQSGARLRAERGYVVTAPAAGRVTAIQAGVGRFAGGQRPLLAIVPEGAHLTATLFAPSRAIGFIRTGQNVRLLYDAFPYERFGSFGGQIVSVSKTVLAPRELDAPISLSEPVYRVSVMLDRDTVDAYGDEVPLQAGMTLRANIVLERRSFLAWLLDPVNAVRNRT